MAEERIRDYLIERLIGAGGMGMVYLAKHENLHRHAAIKVLLENLSANPQIRERFIQEARLMGSLDHPNIVTLYDFTTEPMLSLIMEFVDGRGLDEMIGQDVGPIPWEKALPLFTQILDGIGYAHSKGIVHRDIKPANILISKEGQVKVTDLGIAKIAGQQGMTRTGAQLGTPYYESPEQIKGAKDVDHRSDIYSLGMTLYEMLAGRLPFDTDGATSEFMIMSSVVNRGDHLDPREHYPHIPEWLVKTVQKATDLSPEKRFQSCEHFKQVIEKYGKLSATESSFWSGKVASVKRVPFATSKPVSIGSTTSNTGKSECPKCGAPINENMEFCSKCGTALMRSCLSCKSKIHLLAGYCSKCGSSSKGNKEVLDAEEVRKKREYSIAGTHRKEEQRALKECFFKSMVFKQLPSGSFMMGAPGRFLTVGGAARPIHRVRVSSFELLTTPVTQAMWKHLMNYNPSQFKGERNPVENVSLEDCQRFIVKLNGQDPSYKYYLPTEAQWEYACRAGTVTNFYWGDGKSWSDVERCCWFSANSKSSTHPVGGKEPNSWGLFDMSGNVWEWCQDGWHNNYKGSPFNCRVWPSSESNSHIVRGGSWNSQDKYCSSVFRQDFERENMSNSLGFRVARSKY